MSKIHEVIENVLRRDIQAAADGDGKTYPRGEKKWIDVVVGMGTREIAQWLDDPGDVEAHMAEIRNYRR